MPRKKMPKFIKDRFIYRKVWVDVNRKDQNAIFLFIGDVGKGKSTGALRFGEDLDPNFSLDRVCFSTKELFDLIQNGDSNGKLKPGSVIVFDEAAGSEEAVDARNSLSKPNKILSFFSTISRAKRYIIIYVAPFLSQFDKRIRMIGVTGIVVFNGIDLKRSRSLANFHWSYGLPFSDKTMLPKPRLVDKETGERFLVDNITIPKPSQELIKAYKIKKNDFIDRKIADWRKELVEMKEKKVNKVVPIDELFLETKKNIKDYLNKDGKVCEAKLKIGLGVSFRSAIALRKLLVADGY